MVLQVPSGPWCRYGTRAPPRVPQRGEMTADDTNGRLDDDDYPAYTMGRAAEMLGTTQGFLRAIGEARLITPLRSEGGHRRYSRYQLRIAARARELVDQGTPIEAACRIVILEDQLEEAQRTNAEHRRAAESANPTAAA
jgi:DNA-binding transcriptional MerR regulator